MPGRGARRWQCMAGFMTFGLGCCGTSACASRPGENSRLAPRPPGRGPAFQDMHRYRKPVDEGEKLESGELADQRSTTVFSQGATSVRMKAGEVVPMWPPAFPWRSIAACQGT